MKLGIFKRVFAASAATALVFGMSGCISNSTTDNAKSISNLNDNYNIADYEEEEVLVDPMTKISFSEKGTVRFEGSRTNLIDFWEYGNDESDTIYFEGPGEKLFDSYYERDSIELAFEYKDMIYFLKRTYDRSKSKYNYTLYRMNLKGEDITKLSAFSLDRKDEDLDDYYFDDMDYANSWLYRHLFEASLEEASVEYEIKDVFVENNCLIFDVYYYGYNSSVAQNTIYKIDLTSGISKELMDIGENDLSLVRFDDNYTYLYISDSDCKIVVYKIDNKTYENSKNYLTDGKKEYYDILGVYNNMLICESSDCVDFVSYDGTVKPIFDKKDYRYASVNTAWLVGDYVMVETDTERTYICNLKTGKIEDGQKSDLSKVICSLGDKYICCVYNESLEIDDYDYVEGMSGIFPYNIPYQFDDVVFWSAKDDVLANKHKFNRIKNYPKSYY